MTRTPIVMTPDALTARPQQRVGNPLQQMAFRLLALNLPNGSRDEPISSERGRDMKKAEQGLRAIGNLGLSKLCCQDPSFSNAVNAADTEVDLEISPAPRPNRATHTPSRLLHRRTRQLPIRRHRTLRPAMPLPQ